MCLRVAVRSPCKKYLILPNQGPGLSFTQAIEYHTYERGRKKKEEGRGARLGRLFPWARLFSHEDTKTLRVYLGAFVPGAIQSRGKRDGSAGVLTGRNHRLPDYASTRLNHIPSCFGGKNALSLCQIGFQHGIATLGAQVSFDRYR